ncbi:hypothetical protein DPEC_G00359050 [Dallia pectoralis]|uniref:Uncharacterized protein n=1 Tax=Dallia pectoralis TaxID=75939 RepID=A0ACC2F0F0_DALPE|nr:hypothetical protein DPEC_G00359050 [Dallia pectoralis]
MPAEFTQDPRGNPSTKPKSRLIFVPFPRHEDLALGHHSLSKLTSTSQEGCRVNRHLLRLKPPGPSLTEAQLSPKAGCCGFTHYCCDDVFITDESQMAPNYPRTHHLIGCLWSEVYTVGNSGGPFGTCQMHRYQSS